MTGGDTQMQEQMEADKLHIPDSELSKRDRAIRGLEAVHYRLEAEMKKFWLPIEDVPNKHQATGGANKIDAGVREIGLAVKGMKTRKDQP